MVTQTLPFLFALMIQTFHLPVGLQSSICWVESNHNPKALHKDDGGGNSVGVCQIKLSTARSLGFKGNETQLQDPKVNIYYSARYLRRQLDRYRGDSHKAVAAYNAGAWRLNMQGQIKNRHYVDKVFQAWSRGK